MVRTGVLLSAAALAIVLLPTVASIALDERVVVIEIHLAESLIANEQAYYVFLVPYGYDALRFELECPFHVGAVVATDLRLHTFEGACGGPYATAEEQGGFASGYYYAAASITGLHDAWLRVTGVPSS